MSGCSYLGPYRVLVHPSTLCLSTSLAHALVPSGGFEVGAPLAVTVPLLDRFSNALLLPELPPPVTITREVHAAPAAPAAAPPSSLLHNFMPPASAPAWTEQEVSVPYAAGLYACLVRATRHHEPHACHPDEATHADGVVHVADDARDVVERIACGVEIARDVQPARPLSRLLAEATTEQPQVLSSRPSTASGSCPSTATGGRPTTAKVARGGSGASPQAPAGGAPATRPATAGAHMRPQRSLTAAAIAANLSAAMAPTAAPAATGSGTSRARAHTAMAATAAAAAVAAAQESARGRGGRVYAVGEARAAAAYARITLGSLLCGEWMLKVATTPMTAEAAAEAADVEDVSMPQPELDALVGTRLHGGASVATCAERLEVSAGVLDAKQCVAAGAGIANATLGSPATFTITPRDSNGYTKRMSRGAPFRVAVLNGGSGSTNRRIDAHVDARADGTYRVRYTPYGAAGDFLIQVTFAAQPIAKSPFRVSVHDAANDAPSGASRALRARPQTAPALTATQRNTRHAMGGGAVAAGGAPSVANGERAVLLSIGKLKAPPSRGRPTEGGDALLSRLSQMRPPQQRQANGQNAHGNERAAMAAATAAVAASAATVAAAAAKKRIAAREQAVKKAGSAKLRPQSAAPVAPSNPHPAIS